VPDDHAMDAWSLSRSTWTTQVRLELERDAHLKLTIDYLADHPGLIPTLARWHHTQWSYLDVDLTAEQRMARLQDHLERTQIPTTFVAMSGETLVGSASLIAQDMDTRMDLWPWLASVYVAPEHRRQGVGTALVQRVALEAATLEVGEIYLFTPDKEQFYARRGWSVIERTLYRGYWVVVMSLRL
jgi:N-acetylglutamate synthase-like GNAT family acetyltransferase